MVSLVGLSIQSLKLRHHQWFWLFILDLECQWFGLVKYIPTGVGGLVWFGLLKYLPTDGGGHLKLQRFCHRTPPQLSCQPSTSDQRGFDYNLGHCETCHAMVDCWFWHLLAEVKEEDYKMEKVDGAELAVEEEIVDGVSVPKYVHPNTHISGFYHITHTTRGSWRPINLNKKNRKFRFRE